MHCVTHNGYWFWGRPSTEDLWQDLRAVTREIRPDWDLGAPGVRENWEGDRTMHWPYVDRAAHDAHIKSLTQAE